MDGALGVGRIERVLDLALVVDTLGHGLAQIALDERRRLHPGEVVKAGHAQGADLQHVAKPLGGDQADACALVLQDRVRRDGGAVADLLDRRPGKRRLVEDFGEAVDDRLCVVLHARRQLLGVDGAVGAEQHDVGEGAADVDADAIGYGHDAWGSYGINAVRASGRAHSTRSSA